MTKTHIIIFSILFILSASFPILAQNSRKGIPDDDKYAKEWAKVDSLKQKGLPKEALKIVIELYDLAKADNNSEQYIKAIIFKLKYKKELNQAATSVLIEDVKNELKTAKFPVKNILHSMLADMYWGYYKQYRQKLPAGNNFVVFDEDDIATWNSKRLNYACIKQYMLSLSENDSLQTVSVRDFSEIIISPAGSEELWPVLYDFLAHRALAFFNDTENNLLKPIDSFQLNEAAYFADAATFSKQKIRTKDSLSFRFNALKIYQELLNFRINDTNVPALVNIDLERLNFVYKNSANPQKDSLYLVDLQNIGHEFETSRAGAMINYFIAKYYFDKDKKKALDICAQTIKRYPNSFGAKQCSSLKSKILKPWLDFKAHTYFATGQKFTVQINYKNIDTAYIKIAKINMETLKNLQKKYYGKNLYNKLLLTSKNKKNSMQILPKIGGFELYSTEILLPAQTSGTYVVFISNNKKFDYEQNTVSYLVVQLTDISYIKRKAQNGDLEFYLLNRHTGLPMQSVAVKTWTENYDYHTGKQVLIKGKNYFTDKNGYFRVSAQQAGNNALRFKFAKGPNVLETAYPAYLNYNSPFSGLYTKVYFFTDRAVYRPGQTAYFKGLVVDMRKDKPEVPSVQKRINIRFYGANKQVVAEKQLTTNGFGSFNASFEIPKETADGKMEIYSDFGSKFIQIQSSYMNNRSDSTLLTDKINETQSRNYASQNNVPKKDTLAILPLKNDTCPVYLYIVPSEDALGDTLLHPEYLNLFSAKAAKTEIELLPGGKVLFLIGSAAKKMHLLYEIEQQGKIINKRWIKLGESKKLIEIPFKEEYQGNIALHFSFVNDNRFYKKDILLKVPYVSKKLNISFQSFRNKLYPGEKEDWKLKISGNNGKKLDAEMLVALYDADLEQIAANNWNFDIYKQYYPQLKWVSDVFIERVATVVSKGFYKKIPMPYPKNIFLNWFGFDYYPKVDVPVYSVKKEKTDKDKKSAKPKTGHSFTDRPQQKPYQETAFFYPGLHTDAEGNIEIKFTVPEQDTHWRFLAFAHSKDLKYAFAEKEVTAKKQLAVAPNWPLFFRQGDQPVFSVKIKNFSGKKMEGLIRLSCFDALSMKPLNNFFVAEEKAGQLFSVAANGSSIAEWQLKIPAGIQSVICKVVAKSGRFSDGEQKAVTILNKQVLLSETLPIFIKGKQNKSFELKKLAKSKNTKSYKLSFEFTTNPAYLALLSLPETTQQRDETVLHSFKRFYINSVALQFLNILPKTGQLIEYDKVKGEEALALNNISDSQLEGGAWPWIAGMPGNRYLTQYIVAGLGQLDRLGVLNIRKDKKVWPMLCRAINYLDKTIAEDYNLLKKQSGGKNLHKDHLSSIDIHYLYARSFFKDVKIPKNSAAAVYFYRKQIKKYWPQQNLYEKGMIALVAKRDDLGFAGDVLALLKKSSKRKNREGMYWDEPKIGYLWYQSPIETQALMIEVFSELANNKELDDLLKIWLLKQKQFYEQAGTKYSASAVYALLLNQDKSLHGIKLPGIQIGKHQLAMDSLTAQSGYFKKTWAKQEIKAEMAKVKIGNSAKTDAFSALRWQYFEEINKVKQPKLAIKIEKQLLLVSSSGKGLKPIKAKTKLKLGDKVIVRLIIKTGKKMDYLHITDMHAACFIPSEYTHGYKLNKDLSYFELSKNTSVEFYIPGLPKGEHIFEYGIIVAQKGEFTDGFVRLESMNFSGFWAKGKKKKLFVE